MYFSIGWPKYLDLRGSSVPIHVFCNRDRSLFGILTKDSISVWFIRPCVETTRHKRSYESLLTDGLHYLAEWRPDSSMIVISTTSNHLHFYNVEVDESLKGLYEQYDSKVTGLRRESAELFTKEKVPPISLVLAHNLALPGEINSLVCIRDELMVATNGGHIWRIHWNGTIDREFSLDICRIPFCIDQQQSKGLHFNTESLCVIDLEYSPLIGGFSIVLSNGQAAFLTAATLKFQPDQTFGILAPEVNNATCTAVNHRYRLIAYGLKNAQGIVFCFDDITGALQITHRLMLSSKDFPDVISAAGCVTNLKWTPDGGALAMTWEKGGVAIWSVFGALIMCTLGWDYGVANVMKSVLKISSIEWGPEGYHLWAVCDKACHRTGDITSSTNTRYETCVALMQFAKSALTVNPGMTGREHVFLQGEDRLYISAGSDIVRNNSLRLGPHEERSAHQTVTPDHMVVGNKQWIVVPIPYSYLGSNWPVRYTAVDPTGQNMVVAGRSGFAHYSLLLKRWKLFGNETQEKDFVVMGGLIWWEDQVILGCYNLRDLRDEVRIYPQENKLDNQFSRVVKMATQVLQLSCLDDRLLCFCADSHLTLFHLQRKSSPTSSILHVTRLLELDVNSLVFHPACVVSVLLTSLCTETGKRPRKGDENILLNICGRLMLLQQDPSTRIADVTNNNNQNVPSYSAPTVLASSVENVWVSSFSSKSTSHLTEALWIACGTHGMRVWLPLFPRDGEKHRAHNFMSKRIMLPVNVYIYPIAVLFEDAVILGAENDTVLFSADSYAKQPFCVISRTSQVYLHHILRQLLRRNLGYHAWEIARSCATLPYFPHSLELLLHEVLEEEATSSEPIPDALLPRVIDFIQEFPVFLQTVVQCARKTELALWPYLFSAVGNPKNLFRACINQGQLETAASYLIILQNLEVSSVSHQHATILLDSALESCKWELANELVRFLKAIDPNDVDSPPRSIALLNKYALSHATPPVSPSEDDLSFVLGTASLTRGRSHSTIQKLPSVPTENLNRKPTQEPAGRTISDPHNIRRRRPSEHKEKGVIEECFIDSLLTRHARKLLNLGKLKDLGYLAAHLDFHLVTFFSKERNKAAHISDFIRSLHILHHDFLWPYPVQPVNMSWNLQPKTSDPRIPLLANNGLPNHHLQPVPKFSSTNEVRDSGYISNPSERISLKSDAQSSTSMDVTGQTIEAFLLPKTTRESSLLMFDISENSSLWAEDSQTTVDDDGWQNQPLPPDFEAITEDLVSKGPPHTEIQLRYLLQLLLEAGCLEWSLLIAIVLRDAMAVIRVLNCTRQPDLPLETAKRLRDILTAIELWAEKQCPGYKAFMLFLHNQAKVLGKIGIVGSTPSPSSLKTDNVQYDELYDNVEYNDHRLSTSSDVPSIEGTLVLQNNGPEVVNEEPSGSDSEESMKIEEKANEVNSECVIS